MDLYREEILEHWQHPQNWGRLADFDFEAEVINPLCGDRIKVQVKLNEERLTINDIRYTGTGCAISIASASVLSENIKNRSLKSLESLKGEDILKMIGASKSGFPPARLKCAFLVLEAVRRLGSSNKAKGQAFA